MDFKIPAKDKKEETPSPTFTDKDMEKWVSEEETVNSTICALFVGDPKTGKSGVALDSRTEQDIKDGKKILVIEMNSDNGCKLTKKEFQKDDPNIIVKDPREFSVDLETGDWNFDYIKTMKKIKALLMWTKTVKDKINLKTIVFDGADVFLSEVCENQMRIEKNLDAAGGVTYAYWKNRNKYFYDVMNLMFTIDVDKYILIHFKEDQETKKNVYHIQSQFPDKVHQIVEFRKEENASGKKLYAKIKDDRRNRPDILGKEFLIMEDVDGKRKWNGLKL